MSLRFSSLNSLGSYLVQEIYRLGRHDGFVEKSTPKPLLLVVEDEPNIRELLSTSLRRSGFEVLTATNGQEALEVVHQTNPALLVLDVGLPDMDGYTVTRSLRNKERAFPVLFLRNRNEPEHQVAGLTVGGDDCITKPFSLDELVARVRGLLRRAQPHEEDGMLRVEGLELDHELHEVWRGDDPIDLSPTEFKLLRYLMLHPNRILSKTEILDHVWEYDFDGNSSIVESYISYLRRKVEQDPRYPMLILTKRGRGYVLRTSEKH